MILVVSDKEKDTSSTSGMETSRLTSPLLQHRASSVVAARLREMETAYLARDFETFGMLTMQVGRGDGDRDTVEINTLFLWEVLAYIA